MRVRTPETGAGAAGAGAAAGAPRAGSAELLLPQPTVPAPRRKTMPARTLVRYISGFSPRYGAPATNFPARRGSLRSDAPRAFRLEELGLASSRRWRRLPWIGSGVPPA